MLLDDRMPVELLRSRDEAVLRGPLLGVEEDARERLGPLEAVALADLVDVLEDLLENLRVCRQLLERARIGVGDVGLALQEVSEVGLVCCGDGEGAVAVRVGVDAEVVEDWGSKPSSARTKRTSHW